MAASERGGGARRRSRDGSGDGEASGGSSGAVAAVTSFLAGLAAFAAGYGATYLQSADAVGEYGAGLGNLAAGSASPPALWETVGWFFLGVHAVPLHLRSSVGVSRTAMVYDAAAWEPTLIVVPVAGLLVAGAVAVALDPPATTSGAAARGATVFVGYLPAVAAVAYLTRWEVTAGEDWARMGPSLLDAAARAGFVAPVVVGGIGGLLAHGLRVALWDPAGASRRSEGNGDAGEDSTNDGATGKRRGRSRRTDDRDRGDGDR